MPYQGNRLHETAKLGNSKRIFTVLLLKLYVIFRTLIASLYIYLFSYKHKLYYEKIDNL